MVKTVLWGSVAAIVLAVSPVWASELKIGYVNYGQLLQESPQSKSMQEAIRAEFLPRQRELQSQGETLKTREERLQKDAATMSDEQRTREEKDLRDKERDFQRKQQEAQDDFNARRNEELSRLQRTIIEEVRTYAKAQNFDLVVADGVIYANSAIDITPQVLQVLQSHSTRTSSASTTGSDPKAKSVKSGATTH